MVHDVANQRINELVSVIGVSFSLVTTEFSRNLARIQFHWHRERDAEWFVLRCFKDLLELPLNKPHLGDRTGGKEDECEVRLFDRLVDLVIELLTDP